MIKVVIVGVLFIVNTKTFSQQTLLGGITHNNSSSGSWSLGYTFTPNKNITVTAFRRYFGTKITLWDNVGNVLATQNVSGTNGVWSNHLLGTPVLLLAGQTYKIAAVSGGGNYYWVSPIPSTTFTDGTFSSALEGSGDVNPVNPGSGTARWLVDIVYTACSPAPAPPLVTNNGPRCPGSSATLTASGLAPGGNYLNLSGNGNGSDYLSTVSNNFTIDFWVNPTQTRVVTTQSHSGTVGVNAGCRWVIYPWHGGLAANNRAGAGVSVGTDGISVGEHADSYLPTTLVWNGVISGWTHVAVVYNNRIPSLYVNGNLVATGVVSAKSTVYPSIGSGASASYGAYYGGVDNVRYWNRVLTVAEIQTVKNYELTPSSVTGLVRQYKFNGNQNDFLGPSVAWGTTGSYSNPNYYTYTWTGPGSLPAPSTNETQTVTLPSSAGPWKYNVAATVGTGCTPTNFSSTLVLSGVSTPPLETRLSAMGTCRGSAVTLSVNNPSRTGGEINRSTWVVGSGSVAGFNINGTTNENHRINSTDPWGTSAVVWEARPENVTIAPNHGLGGWNGDQFPVDNSKLYRFSVWVKRSVVGDGSFYLGLYGLTSSSNTGVVRLSSGTTETNPYFYYGSNFNPDEWMLVVGHVYPYTHTGTTKHPLSGIYKLNGEVLPTLYDYKWLATTTHSLLRTYLFYSHDVATRQQFLYPKVDIIDGSEPSIEDLLNGYDRNGGLASGANWYWYNGSCGASLQGTGNTITVTPTTTTRYFVRAQDACGNSVCKEATVVIGPTPTTPTITPNGSTSICVGNTVELKARSSAAGGALSFNGTTDYVDLGNPADVKVTKNLTIEMWLKPTSFTGRRNPISKAYGGEYTFTLESDGSMNCYFGLGGANSQPYMGFNSIGRLTLNQWNHVAFVRENNTLRFYINGVQTNAGLGGADPSSYVFTTPLTGAQSSNNLMLGNGYAGFYAGEMDEVRIWNVARTAAQISANMSRVVDPNTLNLVGYWRFDEPAGSAVLDASGFSQTGTMMSSTTRVVNSLAPINPTFTWTPTSNLTTVNDSTVLVNPSVTTTYSLVASTPQGCNSATTSQIITLPGAAIALSNNNESASCVVKSNNWIHFQHFSGRLIASVQANYTNPNTTITATSYVAGGPGSVADCQNPTNGSLNKATLQRSWVLNAVPAIAGNVTVRLYFTNSELTSLSTVAGANSNPEDNVSSRSDLQLTKYSGTNQDGVFGDNTTCGWSGTHPSPVISRHFQSGNGATSFGSVSNSQYVEFVLNSFSELWLHGGANVSPLPVELLYFLGRCEEGMVNFQWSTASEQNNAFFILERSLDGENWEYVDRISGAGNSNEQLIYTFIDQKSYENYYYRLLQQDYDASNEVLAAIFVKCEGENTIFMYPNPVYDKVNILAYMAEDYENVTLSIKDLLGRVVYSKSIVLENGKQEIEISVSDYSSGTYILEMADEKNILFVEKLIIAK